MMIWFITFPDYCCLISPTIFNMTVDTVIRDVKGSVIEPSYLGVCWWVFTIFYFSIWFNPI